MYSLHFALLLLTVRHTYSQHILKWEFVAGRTWFLQSAPQHQTQTRSSISPCSVVTPLTTSFLSTSWPRMPRATELSNETANQWNTMILAFHQIYELISFNFMPRKLFYFNIDQIIHDNEIKQRPIEINIFLLQDSTWILYILSFMCLALLQ